MAVGIGAPSATDTPAREERDDVAEVDDAARVEVLGAAVARTPRGDQLDQVGEVDRAAVVEVRGARLGGQEALEAATADA